MPRDYTSKDYVNEAVAVLNRNKNAASAKCSETLTKHFDENSSNIKLLEETIEFLTAHQEIDEQYSVVVDLLSAAKQLDIAYINVEFEEFNFIPDNMSSQFIDAISID